MHQHSVNEKLISKYVTITKCTLYLSGASFPTSKKSAQKTLINLEYSYFSLLFSSFGSLLMAKPHPAIAVHMHIT